MAGQSMVNIEFENLTRVEKDVYYMRTSEGNMRVYGNRVVGELVNKGKKIFQESIDRSVYDVPPSTYARTGALRKGVRSRNFNKGLGKGEIFMDEGILGANGYYYPVTVEFGLKRKPNYHGRHFWAKGRAKAVVEFKRALEPYAKELAQKIMNK